jgi:hypothetical protein
MTGGKPVRLTLPSYDIGSADIMVTGKRAGICLAEFSCWRAYLYGALTDRRARAEECEEVTARTLGELRRVLRERVALKGPWWTD